MLCGPSCIHLLLAADRLEARGLTAAWANFVHQVGCLCSGELHLASWDLLCMKALGRVLLIPSENDYIPDTYDYAPHTYDYIPHRIIFPHWSLLRVPVNLGVLLDQHGMNGR